MNGLGLTNLAICGFDKLFPVLPYEVARPWCSLARIEAAPLNLLNDFTRLTNPLLELQGIDAYWHYKGTTTPNEKRLYQTVSDSLEEARKAWSSMAVAEDIKRAGLHLVDAGLSGEFTIADAAAKLLQGERTPTIELLEAFVHGLTVFDCQLTGRPFKALPSEAPLG